MTTLTCPGCSRSLEAAAKYAGQTVRCPHCKTTLAVPPLGKDEPLLARPRRKSQWPWLLCFILTLLIAVLDVLWCQSVKTDISLAAVNATAAFWLLVVYVLTCCIDRRS